MRLPEHLLRNLHDVHEDAGTWLAEFDAHLKACEARWDIRVSGLVPQLSYNVVAFAEHASGTPCVLKMSPPSDDFNREVAALRLYDGRGACRLLRADEGVAAMLLERVTPGISFWNTDDDETATRVAATLMRQLWQTDPQGNVWCTLKRYTEALPHYLEHYPHKDGPLPHTLVEQATGLLRERLQTDESALLHADLHHDNILSATRQDYLAIDPKGIVGPHGYEVGPFLMNPTPDITKRLDLKQVLTRRVGIFSEMLSMETCEVAAWGFIHAILSECWGLEDHEDIEEVELSVAEVLAALL